MKRKLGIWKRKLQFCTQACLLIAACAALGLTTSAQGGDPCNDPDVVLTVEILTDDFGGETTFEVVELGVGVILSGGPFPNNTLIIEEIDICTDSCYEFTIFDSFGDGICCGFGIGFYNIYVDGFLVCSGAEFGSEESCFDLTGSGCEPPGCPTDFEVNAPGAFKGNTCGAGNDIDLRPSADHSYSVNLPNDGVWTFSTCGSGFDTYLFVGTACGLGDIGSNDDSCGLQSEIVANLKAGTYWVTIEAFGSTQCGDYILTMSKEEPCDVDCPAGALEEGEACGSDTNGGCNSVPPVYTNAVCGDVFCGTAWADGGTRDTDWYIVEHGGGILSATLTSQFSGVCFILDGIGTCSPVVVGDIGCSDDCENIANASADLPPGTYVVFVATGTCTGGGIFEGVPCGSGDNDYVLEINCQVPVADAFLDIKPGSCPNSFNRNSNGVLPVALVGTNDFDVTQVDIGSILLTRTDGVGGSIAPHEGPPGPHSVFEDVATPFDASGACTIPNSIITVEILTDDFGGETTWELVEQGIGVIASGGPYPNNTLITVDVDVCSSSCYTFTIFDSFGDGICCGFGIGFYNIFVDGNLACSGGEFGSEDICPNLGQGCGGGGGGCNDPDSIITVEILTDDFGGETTWELVEQGVGVIASGGPYPNNTLISVDVDVCSTSCYDFTIFDSFGDGICCGFGIGFYNIFVDGNLACSGGEFGSEETCPDLGGGCVESCPDPDSIITVEILTDDFGGETTWELVEQGVGVVASGGPYPNNTLITVDVDICSLNCYDFTIFDSFGDGICCGFGIGFYNIFVDGVLACSGGQFGSDETCANLGGGCEGEEQCDCDELGGDGILDLSMKFKSANLVAALELDDLKAGDFVSLTLTGNLLDGTPFEASDCLRIVPPGDLPGLMSMESTAPGVFIDVTPLDETLDGGGFVDFKRTYSLGTIVTLTAPQTHPGWVFVGWDYDGGGLSSFTVTHQGGFGLQPDDRTIEIIILDEFSLKAIYRPINYNSVP